MNIRLLSATVTVQPLCSATDRYDGEAADAGGEEAEEDVGRGDQPEGEYINN
jgi:hypothetical protein